MKISIRGRSVNYSAQSEEDSIKLLEFVEAMAGRSNDPERASLKKRAEFEAKSKEREALNKMRSECLFINQGSVRDIDCHLKNFESKYSLKQLMEEFEREMALRNRTTVKDKIMYLIRKREKEIANA